MPRKVCILGKAPSRDQAPFQSADWEVWALAWDVPPRADRFFEMHELETLTFEDYGADPTEWLAGLRQPVHMIRRYAGIPGSVAYPIDDVVRICGDEFHSSIAWMVGLAIAEGVDVLGLWGVDAVDGYAFQFANLRYLLGVAHGRGIKLRFPHGCPLALDGRRYGDAAWMEAA